MCGVVGIFGDSSATRIAVDALKLLEYRGFDSSGLAVISDNILHVIKDTGRIETITGKSDLDSLGGNVAIGHTRWATHGAASRKNAHPHCDCCNNIAVVHNGIITNYRELKTNLISSGHRFLSETDTEVIPHLIEEKMRMGCSLEAAVMAISPLLLGTYAYLAISASDPQKIVGICKGSPLVAGYNGQLAFAASDPLAISNLSRSVAVLAEAETVVLNKNGMTIFNSEGRPVNKATIEIAPEWTGIGNNGHEYYMWKEINQEPETILSLLNQDRENFRTFADEISSSARIIITACGSSRYASLVGRYYFSKIAQKFCDVVMASELPYFEDSIDKNTVIISVSQSGETGDVVEGVKRARAAGAKIISIINRPQSLLAGLSDRTIYLNCGPEIGIAATKSFINQMGMFYLLASEMAGSYEKAASDLEKSSLIIAETILSTKSKLTELSSRVSETNDIYCIARGVNFAIAAEGSLKLKEVAYMHAEGMPAGELKHGTLSLISDNVPVIAICPNDYTMNETLNNALEAKSRGAYIIGISNIYSDVFDDWIQIPEIQEPLYPLITVVPLQILAYMIAVLRGFNPDQPRNLAKSITVQ